MAETLYEESFTGPNGSMPTGWSNFASGPSSSVGIDNNDLDIKAVDGDAAAYLDNYNFTPYSDWDFVASLNISGISLDNHKVEFYLRGSLSGKIGFKFSRTGPTRKITVYTLDLAPFVVNPSAFPSKIRFRSIGGDLFLDYDIGSGYEFDGGGAYPAIMTGNAYYTHDVSVSASPEPPLYPEVNMSLIDYLVTGDAVVLSGFWHNHKLQTEKDVAEAGSLMKYSTRKVIKSTSKYIQPSVSTGSHSSTQTLINYVCERVI
jgi:hypothetical protein